VKKAINDRPVYFEEKHLHIVVNDKLHQDVKIYAARRNITMSKYIIDAVLARIKQEQQYE
jgi:hypothetical protein